MRLREFEQQEIGSPLDRGGATYLIQFVKNPQVFCEEHVVVIR